MYRGGLGGWMGVAGWKRAGQPHWHMAGLGFSCKPGLAGSLLISPELVAFWRYHPAMLLALLPEIWFAGQPQWLLLLFTVIGMAGVIKGADWLVEGAAGIAARLGMPKIVIGATIVSLGTTSPEAAVSVLAAWQGDAGLALGNGVGSIIADTGLIFGVGCMMTQLPADKFVLSRQGWVQFGSAVLLAGICYGLFAVHGEAAQISRSIGVLLLGLLVWYMVMSVKWSRQHAGDPALAKVGEGDGVLDLPEAADHVPDAAAPMWRLVVMGLVGLGIVIVAGDALVASGQRGGGTPLARAQGGDRGDARGVWHVAAGAGRGHYRYPQGACRAVGRERDRRGHS